VFEVESASDKTQALTDRQRVKRSNVLEAPPKKVSPDSPPNNHLTMYSRIKITTKTHSAYGKTSKGDSWRLELLDPLTGARAAGSRDGCGVKCRYSDYLYIKKRQNHWHDSAVLYVSFAPSTFPPGA